MGVSQSSTRSDPARAPLSSTSMRLCHQGIAARFSSVKHINTSILQSFMDDARWKEDETTEENTQNKQLNRKSLLLLDVRPEEEYNVSHLSGAVRVHMNVAKNEETLLNFIEGNSIGVEDMNIVCYCSVGYRSSFFADKLQQCLKNKNPGKEMSIFNLEGSIFQWANEHRPLVDNDNKPTKYAHPYNGIFGKLLHNELRRNEPENASRF